MPFKFNALTGKFDLVIAKSSGGDYLLLDCSNDPLTGDLTINENLYILDNKKIYFGTDSDASITYDGTEMIIVPNVVGTGFLCVGASARAKNVNGRFQVVENSAISEMDIVSTGASATFGGGFLKLEAHDGALLANNHMLGGIAYAGSTGTTSGVAGAYIASFANQAWSAGKYGTRLEIHTCPTNAGTITKKLQIDDNLHIVLDNEKLYFGAGDDCTIYYDGTDMIINSDDVGSGGCKINGLNVRADGTIQPIQLADASAPNDSIYYSTTANKLVYKDSGGTVNNLY